MTEVIFENTVLMLLATLGINAPAATATKPAISAYSIKSWPCVFRLRFWAHIANLKVTSFRRFMALVFSLTFRLVEVR